jgi:GNAT superfamily N-acetyltransferase
LDYARAGDAIYLIKIMTDSEQRGEGAASKTLERLCEMADARGVTLFLEVEPFGPYDGPSTKELVSWYRRFGFEGRVDEMIREPREERA